MSRALLVNYKVWVWPFFNGEGSWITFANRNKNINAMKLKKTKVHHYIKEFWNILIYHQPTEFFFVEGLEQAPRDEKMN